MVVVVARMYNIYDDYNDATYSSAPGQRDADQA